jgi:nucleoside-diphosphate-sugar epimerase
MVSRFAITGGTGFVGAAVVSHLLARGAHVTVLGRANSDRARLAGFDGWPRLAFANLHSAEASRVLAEAKPEVFLHFAWRGVGGQDRNEAFQVAENVPMTIKTVELAAAAGCRHWIGIGSQAEYGNQNCKLAEDAAPHPTTTYGKAKLAAGIAAMGLCETLGISSAWLRVFSTYGPGDSPQWLIPYVTRQLLNDRAPDLTACEQRWDYLYISDAARAIVAIADGRHQGVFNVAGGNALPLREYIDAIARELMSPLVPNFGAIPYRPDQVMYLEGDVSRLTKATGWRPKVSVVEGIRATVRFERERLARENAMQTHV